ncbi:MAG: intradiol ring-cleavage dioxygenase [Alphaproteobacteria bacterium]
MNSTKEIRRRQALGILGAAGAEVLAGRKLASAQDDAAPNVATPMPDCIATPQQTEGPYFIDEHLKRADIRLDPVTNVVKHGLPLRLRINVSRVDGAACAPLEGAVVDVWQCDATGVYSDVRDFQGLFDTRGEKFLRGYQVSDRNGATEFLTIYPGWYSGRTVHIHFKVHVSGGDARGYELTSQLYFDDAITDQVFAVGPYNAKGPRDTRNGQDGIFRRGQSGAKLLLHLTPDVHGYMGTFHVGLRMA